jgi:hypothetical protein
LLAVYTFRVQDAFCSDGLLSPHDEIEQVNEATVNDYWVNSPQAIEKAALGVKRGKCSVLTKSAGGRDIYLIEYGEKQDMKRTANCNSASYYRNLKVYADKSDAKPVVLIVGASHGGEIEGVTAILNLISALETGKDLRGKTLNWVDGLTEKYRLLIIPCLNIDGRTRTPFEIVPDDPAQAVYYKHGQWLDGTPADYMTGVRVHPILGAVSHMGGYYNDAGVNLYADNYFSPMSVENVALFDLVDKEAPDVTLLLHTGCHKHGKFLQPYYVPGFINKCVMELDETVNNSFESAGYTYYSLREHVVTNINDDIWPPPRFPMESAVTFICGGLSVVYESTEGRRNPEHPFFLENLLNCHLILFEQAFLYASKFQQMCLDAAVSPAYERGRKKGF